MERIFGRFKRAFSVDIVDPDLNIFGDDPDEPLRTMEDVAQYIKQKQGTAPCTGRQRGCTPLTW